MAALAVLMAGAVCLAQSPGAEVYKQRCLNCHGIDGMANSGIGKLMRVKPINDGEVKRISEAAMIEMTRNGVGKMQAYKGDLTDAQIKESVEYFRLFIK